MKPLAIGVSVLFFAACQVKGVETPPPSNTVAVPGKHDDLSELLRKADSLIPEVDESEKDPPPAPVVPAEAVADVTLPRMDRGQRTVAAPSNVPMAAKARATSAPRSSMDTMRADAEREFGPLLRNLSSCRSRFESDYQRYRQGCSGPVSFVQPVPPGGMSLDSIVAGGDDALIPPDRIPPPGPTVDSSNVDRARTPLCRSLLQDIRLQRLTIRSDVDRMHETARRRDFWPGIGREIFEKYGLTY